MKPEFLILGAMKAGTTTLYRDLSMHPDVFLPEEKEPEVLLAKGSISEIESDYLDLLRPAAPGAVKGEASTGYTKLPESEGVAQIALKVCSSSLKLIYLKREPIARMISHYKHDFAHGLVQTDINTAFRNDPKYFNYSRYDWQLLPWRDAFGGNLLELSFEEYIANRRAITKQVCSHIGVNPEKLPDLQLDRSFNSGEARRTPSNPLVKSLVRSRFYQRRLKPAISKESRDSLARLLLTRQPKTEVHLNADLEAELREKFARDASN